MKRIVLRTVSCGVGALLMPVAALAFPTSPADSTLSPASPTSEFTGGDHPAGGVLPNVSPQVAGELNGPLCESNTADCDAHPITFNGVADGTNVSMSVEWDDPTGAGAADYDVYVTATVDGESKIVATSAGSTNPEAAIFQYDENATNYQIEIIPFAALKSAYVGKVELLAGGGSGDGGDGGTNIPDPCVATGSANDGSAVIDPQLRRALYAIDRDATYGAFVHFNMGSLADQDALLAKHGLDVGYDFRAHGSFVYATGLTTALQAIASEPSVSYLEYNAPLQYFGDTQSWATRARVAHERAGYGPYYDAAGQVIDGAGVTLGVIDSGVFGAHPDFADNLLHNFKLTAPVNADGFPQYIDVGNQDSESSVGGHGTHVTGTVAGSGIQSDGGYPDAANAPYVTGTHTGAAPGADLIHWGNGAALFVLDVTIAYAHMLDNLRMSPRPPAFQNLRAVNNSYGAQADDDESVPTAPYNPASAASCLIKEIVSEGVVMAFAAGNDGGDGSVERTSPACKDPTPGVICVASYDDQNTGNRDASLSGFSSRGHAMPDGESTHTYPDITAPGSNITSTCTQGLASQAICTTGAETDWQPWYGTIGGTSMATPHVVGIIGLMTQLDPTLTPAEIEEIMVLNARKVGGGYQEDTQLDGATTHFGFGAGLIDVPLILDAMGARKEGVPANTPFTIFSGDVDSGGGSDVVAMTAQEVTKDDLLGVLYRLTLGSDDISAGTNYFISGNVGGQPYSTKVASTADGVETLAPDIGNNAPAASASIDGATLSVFVPYAAYGFPAAGEPIHNIRVMTSDELGPLDYAPSAAGGTAATDANQPMFGRAWTVLTQAENTENICEAPGLTVLTDPIGDEAEIFGEAPDFAPWTDAVSLHVAQPYDADTGDYTITFTLTMRGLDVTPGGYTWPVEFSTPNDDRYRVRMFTFFDSPPGEVTFRLDKLIDGTFTDTELPVDGTFTPEGVITMTIDAGDIGLSDPGSDVLTGFLTRVLNGVVFLDNMPNSFQPTGSWSTVSATACAPNRAPVVQLNADKTEVAVGELVSFDLEGSFDPDGDDINDHTFTFGDGNSVDNISGTTATHSYDAVGTYQVRADVVDERGAAASSNIVEIVVTEAGDVTAPVGDLTSSLFIDDNGTPVTTINIELAEGETADVVLDASGSGYDNDYAPSAGFDYVFAAGDSPDRMTTKDAVVTHTYDAAGQFTATVQVIDNENGELSEVSSVQVNVTMSVTVTDPDTATVARLVINNSEGPAPLRVEFDGSGSFAGTGKTITSYTFDFGDNTSVTGTDATVSHVYNTPGTYQPTLTVTDSEGGTAQAKITVKANPPTSTGGGTPPPATGGGSGFDSAGGSSGALGFLLMLPMLGLALLRRRVTKA